MTIVKFLTARLDEDEAAAHAADTDTLWIASQYGDGVSHEGGAQILVDPYGFLDDGTAGFIARYQPRRVLADVAAKRETVRLLDEYDHLDRTPYDDGKPLSTAVLIARQMAAVYSDHPDYRQEWNR